MTAVQPSAAAVEESRQLLRNMSAALQTYRLYPEAHPNRVGAVRTMSEHVRGLIGRSGEPPVLFVTRHSFYLGPTLLSRESLALGKLIEAFEGAGVEAVELLPGSAWDIDGLARILVGERPLASDLPGISLNRVRPVLDAVEEDTREMSELLRSYSLGLDVLRDTASRVAAGQPVDLGGARRVIERLATQVAGDPAHALLVTAVKSYDEYTYYHMMNVCILALALGQAIGLRQDQVATLGLGALLHDVGKVRVPKEILQHVGALSEEQWRLIQRHPLDGAAMILLTGKEMFNPAVTIVFEHHAAYDLSGYPKLTGRPRPALAARMVAVADCFDAITSKRSYREPEERRQALSVLQAGAGRGFDPLVVRSFVRLLGLFPIGSLVLLSTGEVAMVVRNHDRMLSRPVVRVILDRFGSPSEPVELDLSEQAVGGGYRWLVERSMDPQEVGVDMLSLVMSGEVEPSPQDPGMEALVHEPSHGEPAPPGYVDSHHENGGTVERLRIDPDVSAPFPR
ncbi:MAG: HD domain-containing protein [Actinomycetota bacterium]|nr:HD domain-containing protein [Actinomycetota bacterium]